MKIYSFIDGILKRQEILDQAAQGDYRLALNSNYAEFELDHEGRAIISPYVEELGLENRIGFLGIGNELLMGNPNYLKTPEKRKFSFRMFGSD